MTKKYKYIRVKCPCCGKSWIEKVEINSRIKLEINPERFDNES